MMVSRRAGTGISDRRESTCKASGERGAGSGLGTEGTGKGQWGWRPVMWERR